MAQGRQHLIIFSLCAVVLLLIASHCHAYPLFNEIPVLEHPNKFHSSKEVNHDPNRMKQYYDTMAQLRFWRRSLAQSSEDEDQSLQDLLQQYKAAGNKL